MSKYRNVGPARVDEIAPQRARHDLRRSGVKMADALRTPVGGLTIMLIFAVLGFGIPATTDIFMILGVGFGIFIRNAQKAYTLPAKIPRHANIDDPMEINPGNGKAMPARGTFYLGNDRTTGEEVWLTNRDAGVHMLVLGTTGSGKTEMLLGLCQNALNQGSGFMFVDGKAQDKIAFKIQDLCRARGRDDDVLILNFMTGARDIIGPQPNKITNTMNPFSYGSSGMISQIVVGLMSGGGGGDDMWKDRAISFVEALSPPLTYLRDNHGLILDVNAYRKYFELEKLEELAWKGEEKFPGLEQVLDPMRNYLINLPGYDKAKFGKRGGQGDDTRMQHGYITMQLVRAFTSLADTYGHIVRVPLGEVYFPDLVKQRRILIAMLPSLEKTPSETANIGKIIVTALRNIMAEGLGSTLEGARDDLENEDGRALLPPYVVILDEYGYYAVKGFAVAFAQARSLGFVCVVGGQDLASFQKESKEEAVSICGNTRIKAFGSIEDPEQTMDFVIKTAGKAHVAETNSYEGDVGMFSMKYADNLNIHLKAVDRIDPSDVKEQTEGQFHFVWRSRVIRAQTFYVNPKRVARVQLNHFVQVTPPDQFQMDEIEMATSGLAERLSIVDLSILDAPRCKDIDLARSVMGGASDLGVNERGISVLATLSAVQSRHMLDFRDQVAGELSPEDSEEIDNGERVSYASGDAGASSKYTDFDPHRFFEEMDNAQDTGSATPLSLAGSSADDAGAVDLKAKDITPLAQMNVFMPGASTGFGAEVFGDASPANKSMQNVLAQGEDQAPLLDFNSTLKSVEHIELQLGASPEEASSIARGVVRGIEDATRYPLSVPEARQSDEVAGLLQELLDSMEEGS